MLTKEHISFLIELVIAAGKSPLTAGDGLMRAAHGVQLLKQEFDRIEAAEKQAAAASQGAPDTNSVRDSAAPVSS